MIISTIAALGTVFVGGGLARALTRRRPEPRPTPPAETSPQPARSPVDPARYDGPEIAGKTLEDWRIDGALVLSTGGLVGLGLGAATGASVAVVVVPMLGVVVGGFAVRAVADYGRDGKVGVAVIDVVSSTGTLVAGHLTALSTFMISVHLTRRIARGNEDRSRRVMGDLLAELSPTAWRVDGDTVVEVPLEALGPGDVIEVRAGQRVPVDGPVVGGLARIDRRALTGEATPEHVEVGDPVRAAEVVVEGRIRVRVEQAGAESHAAQIEALLDEATGYRRRFRASADDVVDIGARASLLAAAAGWVFVGPQAALAIVFAPLCYAMRYTVPISVLGYMRLAAERRVLVKDGRALELVAGVDVVVFDKTGTLTDPVPEVVEVESIGGMDVGDAVRYAAAAEVGQGHPLAEAIRREARRRRLELPPIDDIEVEPGRGVTARVDGRDVAVGSARLLSAAGIAVDAADARAAEASGLTVVYVAVDQVAVAWIGVQSRVRPEAAAVVAGLQARGIEVHLVSGDRSRPTFAVADALGIDRWRSDALPHHKAEYVTDLQARGHRVCFVGDGLNDAVALERAEVAISMGSATALAGDLSAVVLMDDDLRGLDILLELGGELHGDLDINTMLTLVPNAVVTGGALFFGLGFNAAWALFQTGLWSSMAVSLKPLLRSRRDGEQVTRAPRGTPVPASG